MYEWLLFAHVFGVGVLLAGLGLRAVSVERLRRSGLPTELRVLLATAKVGERLVFAGAVPLVAAGVTLAARFWSFSDGWVATSIGLVITQGVVGSVADRRVERLREALGSAREGALTHAVTTSARDPLLLATNRVSVIVIVEILFLMTVKPTAWGIAWSLVVAAVTAAIASWPLFARASEIRSMSRPART